jgi:WD40 repeat protein
VEQKPVTLASLMARTNLLERRLQVMTRLMIAFSAVVALGVLSGFARDSTGSTRRDSAVDSVLVLRALSIVDGRGIERVRIAAPLPDPIMLGRRFDRGEAVSGMLIFDSEGNERGGYITDESRNAALTLDEINRAAVHIATNDRGEAHVSLSNGRGGFAILGMRPSGTFMSIDGKRVAVVADSQAVSAQAVADTGVSNQKPIAVLDRHRAGVTSVKFSPDGSVLATADLRGTIILWRTTNWSPLRTLEHGSELYAIAFSPVGKSLASTGGDRAVAVWDPATGRRVRSLHYDQRALAVGYASSGELLVGTENGILHFINPSTGAERRTLQTDGSIWSLAVSSDGKTLATGLPLRIWDYETLAVRAKPPSLAQLGLAFSANGRRFASAESTGGALLWKLGDSVSYMPLRMATQKRATGARGSETFAVNMPAASIDMSTDGSSIAAGSTTSELYVWSISAADTVVPSPKRLAGHTMSVTAVALSPNRALVASGCLDRTVRIWKLR